MEMAGLVGVDPTGSDLSPRELSIMVKARSSDAWDHTSMLLAKIHNILGTQKIHPDVFHPIKSADKKAKEDKLTFKEKMMKLKAMITGQS